MFISMFFELFKIKSFKIHEVSVYIFTKTNKIQENISDIQQNVS